MYLGRVVEEGPTAAVLRRPRHPYTERLMAAIPNIDPTVRRERVELPGDIPSPINVPPGCRFAPRCPFAVELCRTVEPDLFDVGDGQKARCHIYLPDEEARAAGVDKPTRTGAPATITTADDTGGELAR